MPDVTMTTPWVLTSKELPGNSGNFATTSSDDSENIDVIDMKGVEYTLTKGDEYESMNGIPFDDSVVFVTFLLGDTDGKYFDVYGQSRMVIADVDLQMDSVTLYLPNGEQVHDLPTDDVGSLVTPALFKRRYLSD